MAVKRKVITYFLEDAAHEAFIRAVVDRLAREVGVSVRDDPRSVVHGGRPIAELQRFLHDEQRSPTSPTDLLIIARDGNCKGPNERRREIEDLLQRNAYHKPHVCAIPDPHIERWYLSDGDAVRQALSETLTPRCPPTNASEACTRPSCSVSSKRQA